MKRIEIEDRLVDFTIRINELVVRLKSGQLSHVVGLQVIRSSSSAALNFGEVQSAQSRKDFIHKNSIVLKELRETEISLKIIIRGALTTYIKAAEMILDECRYLVAIFQKTINTLKSKPSN